MNLLENKPAAFAKLRKRYPSSLDLIERLSTQFDNNVKYRTPDTYLEFTLNDLVPSVGADTDRKKCELALILGELAAHHFIDFFFIQMRDSEELNRWSDLKDVPRDILITELQPLYRFPSLEIVAETLPA
jgi:hypothetical protein